MNFLFPPFKSKDASFSSRPSAYLDKPLQLRFIRRIVTVIIGASLLAFVPALYFMNENLNFIRDMLVNVSPDIITYVEREQIFINIIVLALFAAQCAFLMVYSRRMSAQIVAPIKKLTLHFRDLSLGKMRSDDIHIRAEDEFQELINTYNYFYYCLRKQREAEVVAYENALKENLPANARQLLEELLEYKKEQLSDAKVINFIEASGISSMREKLGDSRHVS